MLPTDVLQQEHRLIEQVLNCLEKIVAVAEKTGRLDGEAADSAIDFFRTFADSYHHRKEEDLLFPMMESRGFSRQGGPTGVMLMEHEQGRRLIRGMHESMDGAVQGDATSLAQFAQCARSYTNLLRAHIFKEDHCLFPMACEALGPAERDSLFESFVAVDREVPDQGTQQRCRRLANELADQWGVPRVCAGVGEFSLVS